MVDPIRRATLADVPAITTLTHSAYEPYIPLIGRQPQPMTADYAQMVTDHGVWVLPLGEIIVGVLVLIDESDALLIYSVAIHPTYQKQGLGRHLLDWAEAQARLATYANRSPLLPTPTLWPTSFCTSDWATKKRAREPLLGSTIVPHGQTRHLTCVFCSAQAIHTS